MPLLKFDYSIKKQLLNSKKIYSIDTGLINAIAFQFSDNIGRLLENLVFLNLKQENKEIYYHKEKNECDFVIKNGNNIIEAIQVTKSLENEDTKKREVNGLLDACIYHKLNSGLILTLDEEKEFIEKGIKIKVMPIWKWCLI